MPPLEPPDPEEIESIAADVLEAIGDACEGIGTSLGDALADLFDL